MNDESLKKLLEGLFGEDGDKKANVQVRVIRVMKENIEDDTQEESKPEAAKEPSPEKESERVTAMIQTNIRFAKAMKDAATEFYQLSCLANEILKEDQELRSRLGEK